jgi:hypothetical protein
MVELCIRGPVPVRPAVDAEDEAGLFQIGDVLHAEPDGYAWGAEERGRELFLLVRVQDMSLAEAEELLLPHDQEPSGRTIPRVRRIGVNIPKLYLGMVAPEGRYVVSKERFKAALFQRDPVIGVARHPGPR